MRARRHEADAIVKAVELGGRIQPGTLIELLNLIATKTVYEAHIAVEVVTPTMVKTIDNEDDAQETIKRLRDAPDCTSTEKR